MLELLAILLASGPKGFFQSPGYLIGVPLVALGALGALLVLSPIELRWPQRPADLEADILPPPPGQPTAQVYLQVGLILAVITALEVAVYYMNIVEGLFVGVLLALSIMKFVLVALWFMHLRFDTRLFSILFGGGLALVAALIAVVLATLGSSLI
jgi:cytochrome c oxidase subunit 4